MGTCGRADPKLSAGSNTTIYGRSLAARSLGITLALLLGGYAAAGLGYDAVLMLSAIAPGLAACVLWLLIRDPRGETHISRSRFREVLSSAFSEILPNPGLRHSILAFATVGATFAALEDFLGPFYQEKSGITLGLVGVIFGIAYLGTTSGLLLAERISFKGAKRIHYLMMLAALMLFGSVFIPGPLGVSALVAYFFICAVCFVHLQTRMQVRIQGNARATVTSVAWMLDALVGLGFYLVMGAVAEAFSWHAAFVVVALVTALSSLAFSATSPPETDVA